MNGNRKPIYGVGINDADYVVKKTTYKNGKYEVLWQCPFYQKWIGIIKRCFDKNYHKRFPTYSKCTICDEWVYFSKFKSWMETQDWEGKELDKDIILENNKIYSPSTCCFLDKNINLVIATSRKNKSCMTGVVFNKIKRKFEARCSNPFSEKDDYLGVFDNELDAHNAWKSRKHHYACIFAEMATDERVAKALRIRYA
jgi:hypothetical protein